MKKHYFLNGFIISEGEKYGPFTVDFYFDKEVPDYKQKEGILYLGVDNKAFERIISIKNLLFPRKNLTFIAEAILSVIELRGFVLTGTHTESGNSEIGQVKKVAEFYFREFVEKFRINRKMTQPTKVKLHIEDLVFFRPSLKVNENFATINKNSHKINILTKQFENNLDFKVKNYIFCTTCELLRKEYGGRIPKYKFSIDTKPFLVIIPRRENISENESISAGKNIVLLLSFLEERFIKYISETIYYYTKEDENQMGEFRHAHYSDSMVESWRRDLSEKIPMDSFSSNDIKIMYLKFEELNKRLHEGNFPEVNLPSIFYLYLNACQARMVYYPIVDFYACIEKLLKIGPEVLKDFEYTNSKSGRKHKGKVKKLCKFLNIGFSDLLNKDKKLAYIQIRQDYNHNLLYKHEFKEIMDAIDKARYLCRRIIFSFLGLNYQNYNSCDLKKYGMIGL